MRLVLLFALAAALVSAAPSPSVAGKWTGDVDIKTPDGQDISAPFAADLKCTDGKTVTGTIQTGDSPDIAISKGMFDGEKLTFSVSGDGDMVWNAIFTFDGPDKMKGTAEATTPDGNKVTAKLVVSRQKTT